MELGVVHLSLEVTERPKIFIKKLSHSLSSLEIKNHPHNISEYQITESFLVKLINSSEYQLKLKSPLILKKQGADDASSAYHSLKAEVRWGRQKDHLTTLKQDHSSNDVSEEVYFLNISTQVNKSVY